MPGHSVETARFRSVDARSVGRLLDRAERRDSRSLETASPVASSASVDGREAAAVRDVYRAPAARARCGSVIRSAPQGEHAHTAYWFPAARQEGSRRSRRRRSGDALAGPPRHAPAVLSRRVRRVRRRARQRRLAPVRVRGARLARQAVAVRVPPARARVRRGARRPALRAARRRRRDRRPRARAGGADLRRRIRPARNRHQLRSTAASSSRCSSRSRRVAAASTGTTTFSSRRTPSSRRRSSATATRMARSRRSSV